MIFSTPRDEPLDPATAALHRLALLSTHAEMNHAAHQIAILLTTHLPHCAYLDLSPSQDGEGLTPHSLHTSTEQICLAADLDSELTNTLQVYARHLYPPHVNALPGLLDSPTPAHVRLGLGLTLAHSQSLAQNLVDQVLLQAAALSRNMC